MITPDLDRPRLEPADGPRRVREPQGSARRDAGALPLELRSAVPGGRGRTSSPRRDARRPATPRAAEGLDRLRRLRRAPSRASPSRSISTSCSARSREDGADPGHAPQPGRRQGGRPAVPPRRNFPASRSGRTPAGSRDGYVTGLEPGTNYPNPSPFEKARGRVVTLPVGGRYVAETTLEVLDDEGSRRRRRGRGRATPVPCQADDPYRPGGAVRARGLIFLGLGRCSDASVLSRFTRLAAGFRA